MAGYACVAPVFDGDRGGLVRPLIKEDEEMAVEAQTGEGLQLPVPTSDPDDPIVAMFERIRGISLGALIGNP